jgi:hypothetical protein
VIKVENQFVMCLRKIGVFARLINTVKILFKLDISEYNWVFEDVSITFITALKVKHLFVIG